MPRTRPSCSSSPGPDQKANDGGRIMFADARFGYSPGLFPTSIDVDAEEAKLSPFFNLPDIEADLGSMLHPFFVSQYELGGGDLLEGPEPISKNLLPSLDPAGAANSQSSSENAMDVTVNFDAFQNGPLSSEVFDKGKEEFMDNSAIKDLISELMDVNIPMRQAEEVPRHAEEAMTQIECASENEMDGTVNFGAIRNDPLSSEVFDEGMEEFMDNSAVEDLISELMDVKIPMMQAKVPRQAEEALKQTERPTTEREKSPVPKCSFQKSASSKCLNSAEQINGSIRPNFMDFQGGNVQNLGDDRPRPVNEAEFQSSCDQFGFFGGLKTEERKQKLSRYREKKIKRDFGKKIRYACRKVLADGQPRERGMFIKIEKCSLQMPTK